MIELGLQRISKLLAKTPLPWRAVHVAGTNGKGSICAYVSGMLDVYNISDWRRENGHSILKHARFTSPHLVDRWDCITIDQKPVSPSIFHEVEKMVLARNKQEGIQASEFELLTATAFEVFSQEKVDIAVVEVGMGGRLDATNVIGQQDGDAVPDDIDPSTFRPPPLVTTISSIGLDHQAFLGDTLEEIASEKAGIIKPRVPVVYASNPPAVTSVVLRAAESQDSPLYCGPMISTLSSRREHKVASKKSVKKPPRFLRHGFFNPAPLVEKMPRSLRGLLQYLEAYESPSQPLPHTRENTRAAFLSTCVALQQLGRLPTDVGKMLDPGSHNSLPLTKPPVIEMFKVPWNTVFPGRLQHLNLPLGANKSLNLLLDGAHNAQSATALASEIERLQYRQGGKGMTWILAASDTKDVREILRPLLKRGDAVFAVEFGPVDGMPWVKALAAAKLLEAAQEVTNDALTTRDYGDKVEGALSDASEHRGWDNSRHASGKSIPVVVAGSLYLVGNVLKISREVRR